MNIAALLHRWDNKDIINTINPKLILRSDSDDKFKAFSDMSLKLDKAIYFDRTEIDWVLYINDDNIRFDTFLKMANYIHSDDDSVFYVEHHDETIYPNEQRYLYKNFYCKPHTFSVLGNIYKLRPLVNELNNLGHFIDMTPKDSIYVTDEFLRVWLYAVNRNNFNLISIP